MEAADPGLHFVLVHGIGGGAWCWYRIRTLLERCGHKVSCVDLKSSGIDPSDPNTIVSFEDYNKPLIDLLHNCFSSQDHHQKVILVGHSAGGLSVTDATLKFGKKIRLAIYVAATMLRSGFRTPQDASDGVPDLSEFGDVYDLQFALGLDKNPTSSIIKGEFQRKILYQNSPLEDSMLASMLIKPGPLAAILSAQFEEIENIEQVPRVYIKTTNDRVIKPDQQDSMIKRWTPSDVFVLESDHSPYFSAHVELFDMLVKAVAHASL
ncbi:hypothetical protein Syun_016981 [Stephania yunnanensis]|uniref:AB hydrolase-1 domain-containing protein n=1 Tax=Stephania yunnanensis TaxID=152371 RepID=A0AAP0P2X8_9MAGN